MVKIKIVYFLNNKKNDMLYNDIDFIFYLFYGPIILLPEFLFELFILLVMLSFS